MRLVGIALFTAWVLAWWSSPHGEPARQTTIVGGVAIAGGDEAALAWLELSHGMGDRGGQLHVAFVDENNRVKPLFSEDARPETGAFRLAEAGGGGFVLAREMHDGDCPRSPSCVMAGGSLVPGRTLVFEPFNASGNRYPATILDGVSGAGEWQFATAGSQLAVSERVGDHDEARVLGDDGEWMPPVKAKRILLAASDGRLVRYEVGAHGTAHDTDRVVINPSHEGSWALDVAAPDCAEMNSATTIRPQVTSVLPLRGGYARLSRLGNLGCVDGLRDGQAFRYKNLDLHYFAAARLQGESDGGLGVYDVHEGQITTRRLLLPAQAGGEVIAESLAATSRLHDSAYRYRLFGHGGRLGIPSLGTRIAPGETEVLFERYVGQKMTPQFRCGLSRLMYERTNDSPLPAFRLPAATDEAAFSRVLAPMRAYQPDSRPLLIRLSFIPLFAFALAALASLRLLLRLMKLAPAPADLQLAAGPLTVEGTLATDADSPEGGLRLRRGRTPMRLFIEGAEVLRASEVRPRDQPRGDAVDVASGSPVVATGIAEPGNAFRAEDTLRARAGDLVIVGCTLAEARTRVAGRLYATLALLAGAALTVVALALR